MRIVSGKTRGRRDGRRAWEEEVPIASQDDPALVGRGQRPINDGTEERDDGDQVRVGELFVVF